MKVSFPLSLKVSLWLLLNLLLLGAAGVAFLVAQGGLSWDSLVAGRSGDRIHALAELAAGETAGAPIAERDAVLARFAAAYHAEFLVFRNRGEQLAGPRTVLPAAVRQRCDEGPPGPRGPRRAGPGLAPRPDPSEPIEPGGSGVRNARGRFVIHTSEPGAWWIGFRVPFREPDGMPGPATLLIHTDHFWSVVQLLNLETWLAVAGSVLLLSILFWLPLVRSITHDLKAVTTATEKIAEGRFDTRLPTGRRDEIGRLGESVNTMAARLDTLVNGQKRFLADVAHELGSPLARLQVATELLEQRAGAGLQESVTDIREEVEQLSALVNELMQFTRTGLQPRETGPVALDPLVARVLAREDRQQRVAATLEPQLTVLGAEALLDRALGNVVRNALRYAGDAGPIRITATAEGGVTCVVVEDEGPGVPVDALQRLGEPFYRPDVARARDTGGVGLGLAIVRTSVAACGGEVRFENRTPRGFRVTFRLNAASATA